jgi:threonine dehydratase
VTRRVDAPTVDDVRAARERIAGSVMRTPLVRLYADGPAEIYLKLENLQPIGSFKLRGALNAMRRLSPAALQRGVYTASAGNMAQGVAWGARELGVPCRVIVPDTAPETKLAAVARLGARVMKVPYAEWWQTLVDHGHAGVEGTFIHPVADADVIAGNGTIGLEVVEDLPDVDAVVVPFGGGGLSSGIAIAVRAVAPRVKIYAGEVETATPFKSALVAGKPVVVERTPSFVDGIGGRGVLDEMWPLVSTLLDDSLVVTLDGVAAALRLVIERNHVVAEGAGAAPVAAALAGLAGAGRVACVVSGGNIDPATLATLLA